MARGILSGVSSHIHSTASVDAGAYIGDRCSIAQNCVIGKVRIGHGCELQSNVSVYDGVTLEDDVFVGASCVFTNVSHPRAHVSRKDAYERTLVCKGTTIGANATILPGITIGEYAMIGAGAVVTRDVPPHAIVVGSPGRRSGWACRCGETLRSEHHEYRCHRCGEEYAELDGLLEAVPPVDPTRSTQKTLER